MDVKEEEKAVVDGLVTLKLPVQIIDFAEFYAELGNEKVDVLLTDILTERLKEIKEQVKALPYIDIMETW